MLPLLFIAGLGGEDGDYMKRLYVQYHKLMFSVAWHYTKDPHEVEDIVSDSCLKLMKNLATLKTLDVLQQQVYIAKTVKHTAFDGQKKEDFLHEHSIPIDAETVCQVAGTENVAESVELKEKLSTVLRAIDSLPEKERLVLILYSQKQKNYREIASIAGLSEESVHKYLSRARSKIRAAICKEEGNS